MVKCLAPVNDVFMNDAFSVSHRAHASVDAVTNYFPVVAAGFAQSRPVAPSSAPTAVNEALAIDKKTAAAIAAAVVERVMRSLQLGGGQGRRSSVSVEIALESPHPPIDFEQVNEDLLDLLQEHVEAGE